MSLKPFELEVGDYFLVVLISSSFVNRLCGMQGIKEDVIGCIGTSSHAVRVAKRSCGKQTLSTARTPGFQIACRRIDQPSTK